MIRPYRERQVEIMVPTADEREREQIKMAISTGGVLQFRVVANAHDHEYIIALAEKMAENPDNRQSRIVRDERQTPVGLWVRIGREGGTK